MEIEYRKGDLMDTDAHAILHGCNAQGVMGSGVAALVRKKYPEAYEVYRKTYEMTDHFVPGLIIPAVCDYGINVKIIINAITQEYYGRDGKRYVSYDGVAECLKKANSWLYSHNVNRLAMPQIGAGLGGGDWRVIEAIIESEMTNVKPIVYVYR